MKGTIIIWSLIALLFLVLFPFALNGIANMTNITSKADFSTWIGFMGSYIGGIVSGAITFIGVLIGFYFERRKNLVQRYLSVSIDIEKLSKYLKDDTEALPRICKVADESKKNKKESAMNWLKQVREKYTKYEEICGSIDIKLLRELREFNTYLLHLYYEFEMSFSDDEEIVTSAIRNFNEDFENLKKSEEKLQKNLKQLELILDKYL